MAFPEWQDVAADLVAVAAGRALAPQRAAGPTSAVGEEGTPPDR